jgi:cysteinyl-tRNA synthetase
MLTMNGLRMSKSTGNYILPMELVSGANVFFEKAFHPNIVRFCFMQAHYRSVLDISNDAMLASEKGFTRIVEGLKLAANLTPSDISSIQIEDWKKSCYDAMNDDFNTPILIAQLFEGIKYVNLVNDGKEQLTSNDIELLHTTLHTFFSDILGLTFGETQHASENHSKKLDGTIELLIEMRNNARANKNWALSDEIRDKLAAVGIILKDGKEGTTYTY